MTERVIPFSELNQDQLKRALRRVNWILFTGQGKEIRNWARVRDQRYGTVAHVAIIDEEKDRIFDKIDLEWTPAAFVVPYRINNNRHEFFIQTERRVLLKDKNGIQGNVFIRNIPQGLVQTWEGETSYQAARREVMEETGMNPKSLTHLEDVYFDAANSSTTMPFYLAEVEYQENFEYHQNLDEGEDIQASGEDWFALEDAYKLRLQCAKTMSGLWLAMAHLEINSSNL